MKTSAFTPTGLLRLRGEEPLARRLYKATRAVLGPELTGEQASLADTFAYALAMAIARSATLVERAFGQMLPGDVTDLLDAQEEEYGLIPSPTASLTSRRRALAARMLLPGGAGRLNVENSLRALLGGRFIAYRTARPSERAVWPADLAGASQNLALPTVARKLVRVVPAVSVGLGAPQAVAYAPVDPIPADGDVHTLDVGDRVFVEPELLARAELVTVAALGADPSGAPTLTATFQHAHEPGCLATTAPLPTWTSTQRFSLVVVEALAALDPEVRRQVHELMDRIARGVSTWAIVQATAPHQAGPFILGKSPLGATPLGVVAI
jgi:hypothetical protein